MNILINNSLKKSACNIYDKSKDLCGNGVMDENCHWYHSIWQYLRLLNVVSSPTWHDDFYSKELFETLKDGKQKNILISGTADYSMLAYVSEAVKKYNKNASIYVLDTCKTPLYCCQWYADKNNINIHTVNEDILKYNNYDFFDVICTDAFLTRFKKSVAKNVITSWGKLLRKNGKIITTIRIHEDNELDNIKEEREIKRFKNKVEMLSRENEENIKLLPQNIADLAENYARKMKSNDLGKETDILSLFENFKIRYNTKTLSGELRETKYIELVAEKND